MPRAGFDGTEAQVLDLEELVDPVMRALASDARLLVAAERGALVGEGAGVDADDAELELLADAPHPRDVTGEEVGGEPELGGIRELDRFLLGREAEDRGDRAERLLAGDLHRRRRPCQDRRLEERPA